VCTHGTVRTQFSGPCVVGTARRACAGTFAAPQPSAPHSRHPGARQRLELLAGELDQTWPDAAGSLREGMDDTLTLMRLGITGQLAKTLCSTNPCESMIEIVRYTQRNVKRWQDGDMRKRWTAAGMLVAEQQFRRIIGYRDLATLVIAVERHAILVAPKNPDRQEIPEPVTV
jgi:hypothetical protein